MSLSSSDSFSNNIFVKSSSKSFTKKNDSISIRKLIGTLTSTMTKSREFNNINIICTINNIKNYEWASYFELTDNTGTLNGYISKIKMKKPLKPNNKISATGTLKIDKYNRISFNVSSYDIIEKDGNNAYKIVKNKLRLNNLLFSRNNKIHDRYFNIGLITSKNAAGLKDSLNILRKNMPFGNIYIYNTLVQGSCMSRSMINQINCANDDKLCDVLLITRGGGAKSDLNWFNDYELAISVINSKIPITCGIGHEIDKTIIDKIVDKSFITPSDAANCLTNGHPNYKKKISKISNNYDKLISSLIKKCNLYKRKESIIKEIILEQKTRYNSIITEYIAKIQNYKQKLQNHQNIIRTDCLNRYFECKQIYAGLLNENNNKIIGYRAKLEIIRNPLMTYPMVIYDGKFVKTKKEFNKIIQKRGRISIMFEDGSICLTK